METGVSFDLYLEQEYWGEMALPVLPRVGEYIRSRDGEKLFKVTEIIYLLGKGRTPTHIEIKTVEVS